MTPRLSTLPTPVPLASLPRRCRGIVVGHDVDAATSERLAALGLGVGAAFTVLQPGERPTVLVGDSRIGLSPELAGAIGALRR